MKKMKSLMVSLGLVILLGIPGVTSAIEVDYPGTLSQRQIEILILSYEAGLEIGFPETIQAIAFQESNLGTYNNTQYGIVGDIRDWKGDLKPVGERSYGVLQVKVDTARRVLRTYPHLAAGREFPTDEHIIAALLTDDWFNITIGAYYFYIMYNVDKSWKLGLLRYNGVSDLTTDPNQYKAKVWNHIVNLVRPFNKGEY